MHDSTVIPHHPYIMDLTREQNELLAQFLECAEAEVEVEEALTLLVQSGWDVEVRPIILGPDESAIYLIGFFLEGVEAKGRRTLAYGICSTVAGSITAHEDGAFLRNGTGRVL